MQGQTNLMKLFLVQQPTKKRTKKRKKSSWNKEKKWEKNIDHKQDMNHGLQWTRDLL